MANSDGSKATQEMTKSVRQLLDSGLLPAGESGANSGLCH